MTFYLIILLILIGLGAGLIIWIYRLYNLYRKGNIKSLVIQISVLTILIVFLTWQLQLFPLSKNFYIKKQTTKLTGKSFWSWKEFSHDEWGVRGEGYTLHIYKFNQEAANYFKNPDSTFFKEYPPISNSEIKWTETPVKNKEIEILEFATPVYAGWKGEIVSRQDFIREIATNKGAYYAYRHGGSTDFYIISPKDRLVILINHNM
jgi:hypothetical protein